MRLQKDETTQKSLRTVTRNKKIVTLSADDHKKDLILRLVRAFVWRGWQKESRPAVYVTGRDFHFLM